VAFYVVYIHEAHPSDAWQMASNIHDQVVFATPASFEERSKVAGSCVRRLGIEIPALVDDMKDAVEAAYTGWPDRLYVIGPDGRVVYKSAAGPFGFHPARMERELKRLAPAAPKLPTP